MCLSCMPLNVSGGEIELALIHSSFQGSAAVAVFCMILSIIIQGFTAAEVNNCPGQTTGCNYAALQVAVSI